MLKKVLLVLTLLAVGALVADSLEVKTKMRDIAHRLNIKVDEFNYDVFYDHVNYSLDSCQFIPGLVSDVNRDHVTYLIDAEYNGHGFINMAGVIVLVGHQRFEVKWDSSRTTRKSYDDGEWENKSVAPDDFDDSTLVDAICDAPADTVVKVRLNGELWYDFVMSPAQRLAWKDVTYYYRNFAYRDSVVEKTRIKE